MRYRSSYDRRETKTIHLPGIRGKECELGCRLMKGTVGWPDRESTGRKGSVRLSIRFDPLPSTEYFLSIGLLARDDSERSICGQQGEAVVNISKAWLRESAEIMLPGGTLNVCFKIFYQSTRTKMTHKLPQLGQPTENLFSSMVDNSSFVDIGPSSSVLLVFADGKQRCHTFPLAARHGLVVVLFCFINFTIYVNYPP